MNTHERPASCIEKQVARATEAIRLALRGLESGTRLMLEDVFAAFVEVRRVTKLRTDAQTLDLPTVPAKATSDRALSEYRSALVEWYRNLPRLHGWLLAERARLSCRRAHAESVQTWIETDRQTRKSPSLK
jgi:hypothetical protein